MSIFYDPIKKEAHKWPIAVCISIPLIIMLFIFLFNKHKIKNGKPEEQITIDIFDKF